MASWDLCGQVGPVVVKAVCGLLGAPNLVVGVCPKVVVRDSISALKEFIVEGGLSLCGRGHRRIG